MQNNGNRTNVICRGSLPGRFSLKSRNLAYSVNQKVEYVAKSKQVADMDQPDNFQTLDDTGLWSFYLELFKIVYT